jgi:hypothetical protein
VGSPVGGLAGALRLVGDGGVVMVVVGGKALRLKGNVSSASLESLPRNG